MNVGWMEIIIENEHLFSLRAIERDDYSYITATYYLLAERVLAKHRERQAQQLLVSNAKSEPRLGNVVARRFLSFCPFSPYFPVAESVSDIFRILFSQNLYITELFLDFLNNDCIRVGVAQLIITENKLLL